MGRARDPTADAGRMVRLRYAVAYDLGADTISPGELNRIVERGAPIMTTLSRRALVVSSASGAALAHLAPRHQVLAQSSTPTASSPPPAQEAGAPPATWRTWILTTPDELRPVAPAASAQTEIDELLQFQAERNDETIALIRQWNSRPAVLPWTEVAFVAGFEFMTSPLRQNRLNGMLQTAMYDAVIAAYDAQVK